MYVLIKGAFALDSVATPTACLGGVTLPRLTPDTSCNSGVSHYVCCG